MKSGNQVSKICYGAAIGALALLVASLSFANSGSEADMGEAWLTSLREQGL